MAYQNLKIHPPGLRHSDELLNFTKSVVNMEREISQISSNNGKPKNYEIHNPQNCSEQLIADTHDRRTFEMQKNVNFSLVVAQGNNKVKIRENLKRKKQMTLLDDRDKPGFGKERVGVQQDVEKQGGHGTKLPDNVIWTPSKIRDVDGFENGICNISLSRVYFAQQFDGKDHHLVAADTGECAVSGPEKLECRNVPQKNTRLVRQKNAPMVIQNRRQSAPSPLTNSVPKPARIRAMFRNQTDCGISKRADTRCNSETQEYVYFLPKNQEREEEGFRCNARSPDAKSEPSKNEHLLPEKRVKNKPVSNVVLDAECVDEVATCKRQQESENRVQSSQLQVVADSDGRILVNISNNDDKHRIEAQKPIISEEADNNEDLGRENPGVTSQKDHLQKANHVPIEREKPCYKTSILITNDQHWDSWKRVNCIPSEDDATLLNPSTRQGYSAKPGHRFFDDRHEIISLRSEDVNNIHSPPYPSKLIHHTARQCASDNSGFRDPEAVVMQDSSYSKYHDEQNRTTHSQRYFESSSTGPGKMGPRVNHFRGDSSTSSASKERDFGSHERVGSGGYQSVDAVASMSKVKGRKTIRSHNPQPQGTLSYSFQVLDKDDGSERFGEPGLRQKAANTTGENLTDTPVLLNSNFDVHTSCSGLGNKNCRCRLGGLQPPNQHKAVDSVPSTTDEAEKRKSELIESFTTHSDSETESRYNCDWPACKKSFRHYSFLVLHKRIHTGERPYVCSWKGCTKQFRRSDDYQRHYRVHTGAKPYICSFCGKGFKRSDHRLFHYRAIHNIKDLKRKKK